MANTDTSLKSPRSPQEQPDRNRGEALAQVRAEEGSGGLTNNLINGGTHPTQGPHGPPETKPKKKTPAGSGASRPGATLPRVEWQNGLKITGSPVWIDATQKKDLCIVTIPADLLTMRHRRAITSRVNASYVNKRTGPRSVLGADHHQPLRLARVEVTLLPAGYGPGSCQAQIKTDLGHILYTSGFSLGNQGAPQWEPFFPGKGDVMVIRMNTPPWDPGCTTEEAASCVLSQGLPQAAQAAKEQGRGHDHGHQEVTGIFPRPQLASDYDGDTAQATSREAEAITVTESPLLLPAATHKAHTIARGLTPGDGLLSRATLQELTDPARTTLILLHPWMLPRLIQRIGGGATPIQIYRTLFRTLSQTGLDSENVPVIIEDALQLKSPPREGGLIFMPSHLAGSELLKNFLKRIKVNIMQIHPKPGLPVPQGTTGHRGKRKAPRRAQSHAQGKALKKSLGDSHPVNHYYMVNPVTLADLIEYIRHVNPKQIHLTGDGAPKGKAMLAEVGIEAGLLQDQKQFSLL